MLIHHDGGNKALTSALTLAYLAVRDPWTLTWPLGSVPTDATAQFIVG